VDLPVNNARKMATAKYDTVECHIFAMIADFSCNKLDTEIKFLVGRW
jgi:hypothetical protein